MYSNGSFVQEVNGHLTTYDEFLKTAARDLASSSSASSSLSPTHEIQHSTFMHHNLSHESLLEAR